MNFDVQEIGGKLPWPWVPVIEESLSRSLNRKKDRGMDFAFLFVNVLLTRYLRVWLSDEKV